MRILLTYILDIVTAIIIYRILEWLWKQFAIWWNAQNKKEE